VLTCALLFLTRAKPSKIVNATHSGIPVASNVTTATSDSVPTKPVAIGSSQQIQQYSQPKLHVHSVGTINESSVAVPLLRNSDENDVSSIGSYDDYRRLGQFRTNTYDYSAVDSETSSNFNNFRASDMTTSHLRLAGAMLTPNLGGFRPSTSSLHTSENSSRHDEILTACRPGILPKR
jgi:hypothetical protein